MQRTEHRDMRPRDRVRCTYHIQTQTQTSLMQFSIFRRLITA